MVKQTVEEDHGLLNTQPYFLHFKGQFYKGLMTFL